MIEKLAESLAQIVGRENVLDGSEATASYGWDAVNLAWHVFSGRHIQPRADVVVKPRATEQVVAVVRLASAQHVPLIPYGGGTGVMGAALPVSGGIVVDLRAMSGIRQIDQQSRTATVQSGILLGDLETALGRQGLMLGHDPWSVPIATVGGAISTDGVGYLAARYGTMGQQVLGLEVVLPSGELLRTRGVPASSPGISLHNLFIGAEGSLGIITEATLQVFPQPEMRRLRAFRFPSFQAGFRAVDEMYRIGLVPAMVDYTEEGDILPSGRGTVNPAVLHLACEGFREEVLAQDARAEAVCTRFGAEDLGHAEAQGFWDTRHRVAELYAERQHGRAGALPRVWTHCFAYPHLSLSASKVLDYRATVLARAAESQIAVRECSLWARPEFFSMVLAGGPLEDPQAVARFRTFVDQVLMLAQDLGGSMEYCHGIGLRLAHLLSRELGSGYQVLKAVKQALDPNNIMNPGKLFDD